MSVDLNGKRILIVKLRYIGDTLSVVPVVENLAKRSPGAAVDVLVNRGTEPVIAYHPGIRKVWVYDYALAKQKRWASFRYQRALIRDLRAERYDIVIDYTHGDRAALLCFLTGARVRITHAHAGSLSRLLMNRFVDTDPAAHHIVDHQLASLRLLGFEDLERTLSLHVPEAVQQRVDRWIERARLPQDRPWVVIHPGARGPLRMWRPERFAEIAGRVQKRYGAAVILVGGPGEGDLLQEVAAGMAQEPALCTHELSLLEMGELLRRSSLFVGNDSAPGHLAAAVACPTVSLFGPTFPHMWRPLSPEGEVLFKNVPCCGCRQETCIRPESGCMDMIGVDEVWERVRGILEKRINGEGAVDPSATERGAA
jgi:predicted lipopolysaccharide heptosyltransferase III